MAELPLDAPLYPSGQAFHAADAGADYVYFARPFPDVRVRADLASVKDLASYEGFTCLAPGAATSATRPAWTAAPAAGSSGGGSGTRPRWISGRSAQLVKAGKMKPQEAWFRPADAETGEPVRLQGGSVNYNAFRKRWVMIAVQQGGGPSFLGEVWYAEAEKPEGPWPAARKVLTHDRYSFYNPAHHPFFDQDGGRVDLLRRDLLQHLFGKRPPDAAVRLQPGDVPPGPVRPPPHGAGPLGPKSRRISPARAARAARPARPPLPGKARALPGLLIPSRSFARL